LTLRLSNADLDVVVDVEQQPMIAQLGRPGAVQWIVPAAGSPLFAIRMDGRLLNGTTKDLVIDEATIEDFDESGQRANVRLRNTDGTIEIEHHVVRYPGSTLIEQWQTVRNVGQGSVRIDQLDSFHLNLSTGQSEVLSFTGSWGLEFEPHRDRLSGELVLETRSGRASNGRHPWFAVIRDDGEILAGAIMWSGNWVCRFEPIAGGYRMSGGLHDWEFFKDLAPGETIESPHVAFALGRDGDLNTVSNQFARVGRRYWYAQNDLSRSLPAEWNHWWSYEDRLINEDVMRSNIAVAADLGLEICTLDAGWFGPSDTGTHWYDYRGDWDLVNAERFPNGIRPIADEAHSRGMKFGIWCEIESLGVKARLAEDSPHFVALRGDERLGYVCFGNPEVQAWAFDTLDRLVVEHGADWIKLDFNLDPGAGCNRTDHGHGEGDGLFAHYRGYYAMLDRFRERHPDVMLENCSSGGLRIDLEMLRHLHTTFLSDPDWPEHSLQLFWGATLMLAPDACLRWSYGDWLTTHRAQLFNPHDPALQPHQFDYYTRIAMMSGFGISQRLPDLPAWVAERLADHVQTYRELIRPFVRSADFYRRTDQPKRWGEGDRWAAFQFAMPDTTQHLIFVFRLPGGEPTRTISLCGLVDDRLYSLRWLGEDRSEQQTGRDLMQNGITFDGFREEESALVLID
jgi:alpha-galactosidase